MTFKTDKVANGYLPTYLRLASKILSGPQAGFGGRVLELGVDNGHSIRMWEALFPQGVVVGVDNRQECEQHAGPNFVLAEQDDPQLPYRLASSDWRWFDLIVDDASHRGDLTSQSFQNLWPLVDEGGYYVIEDWWVGYPDRAPMYEPSMRSFAQRLVDRIVKDEEIAQISYLPGLIVVEKV